MSIPKWANYIPEEESKGIETRITKPWVNYIPPNPSDDLFHTIGGQGGKREGVILAQPSLDHDPVRVERGEAPSVTPVALDPQAVKDTPKKKRGRPARA